MAAKNTCSTFGRPGHDLDDGRALDLDQMLEFGANLRVTALGHVVARAGGKLGVGRFVLVGVLGLFDKSLVHVMEFVKERRC